MGLYGEPKMAMCPTCAAPLISTCAFPKYEFYCLECGWLGGFLSPVPAMPTPELAARHAELMAEWGEHASNNLLTPRSWLSACEKCKSGEEYHSDHATDEEREADRTAREWLAERAGKVVVANG